MQDWTETRPDNWHTMREHFCFLPLQISHFDELGRVAAYLHPSGLEDEPVANPSGPARMTPKGDILIATQEFSALASSLQRELDLDKAIQIRRGHQQRLKNLRVCAKQATISMETSWNHESWQCVWSSTAQAIAELAPYGLVSKILPNILLERLGGTLPERSRVGRQTQRVTETFPLHLSSNALTRDVRDLVGRLRALDADEPGAQGTARRDAELERFCQGHVGLGPRAWEAPGYEDPQYVLRAVVQAQPSSRGPKHLTGAARKNPGNLPETSIAANESPALAPLAVTTPGSGREEGPLPLSTTWEQELEYWASQLDTQTSVLRWGFLTVELPLLRGLAPRWISAKVIRTASDLLYCTRYEIGDSPPSHAEIARRRDAYRKFVRQAGRPELTDAPEARMDSPSSAPLPPLGDQSNADPEPAQLANTTPDEVLMGQSVSSTELRSGAAWPMGPTLSSLPTRPDAVVVARHLTPELTPALLGAAAVVVEEGGLLQHAAIVAREIGIPCVVGCRGLVERVTPGMFITVDGRDGRVTIRSREVTRS